MYKQAIDLMGMILSFSYQEFNKAILLDTFFATLQFCRRARRYIPKTFLAGHLNTVNKHPIKHYQINNNTKAEQ